MEHKSKSNWSFLDVLRVLEQLYIAQKAGEIVSITSLRKSIYLPHHKLNDLLDHLQRYKWVNESNGQWLLSRDLRETELFDLHKILPVRLPIAGFDADTDPLSDKLKHQLNDQQQLLRNNLSVTIADFLSGESV